MNKLILILATTLLGSTLAYAETPAPAVADKKPVAEKKGETAMPATDKKADAAKPASDEKKMDDKKPADMKTHAKKAAGQPAAEEKPAVAGKKAPSEKQLKQQEKMKTCNKEAKEKTLKGAERKKFMSECLKG